MGKIYIETDLMQLAMLRWQELTNDEKNSTTIFDIALQIDHWIRSNCNRFRRTDKVKYNNGILEIDEKIISPLQHRRDIIELERRKQHEIQT